jgi:hypothetical protein
MFPGTAPNGTNAVAVYDNFFRALAAPARLSRRPAGMSWRTPDQNARKRERAWTIAEHSRRSGCNVENRCTKQSENNETERGLRIVKHLRSLSPLGLLPTTPREPAFHVAVARASNGTVRTLGY